MSPEPLVSARTALIVFIAVVIGLVMGFLAWRGNPTKPSHAVMIGLGAGGTALMGLHALIGPI